MPKARVFELELAYDTHGDAALPPVLLIMGLGAQLVAWDDDFIELLLRRGLYVIRFDNRDVGESTHLDHLAQIPFLDAMMRLGAGESVPAPYSLSDMAGDTLGLLDALQLRSAHVVGLSMGGMIAQELALLAPDRVRSLTSIMSTTNDPGLPQPAPQAIQAILTLMGSTGPGTMEQAIAAMRSLASPGYPFDEDRMARRLRLSNARGFSPTGMARQFLAIVTARGRGEALQTLRIPTLVIHGEADLLVPPAAGRATAEAIPAAKLLMVPGMGHDVPSALFSTLATAITEHILAAEAAGASSSK